MTCRIGDARIVNPLTRRVATWPIGEQMREVRADAGRTQRWVGRHLYVSERTVREWECGRRKPTVEMLDAYLRLLGGSITLGVVKR
jgi:transcriptional regulator with XRE-family HTH domain